MKFLIALIITIGSVLGGYVLSKGNLAMLWHPFEIIMIFGGAIGIYVMSNTPSTLIETLKQLRYIFKSPVSKKKFVEVVKVMNDLTKCYMSEGGKRLESHLSDPDGSDIFSQYPTVVKDAKVCKFICDNFVLVTNNDFVSHELADYLDEEIEKYHHEMDGPSHALAELGDTMPGLGIVVAVLGIIISMGFIDGDPAELGDKISTALFGTFIGIFAGYGLFKPMAAFLHNIAAEQVELYKVMKFYVVSLSDSEKSPMVTMEIAHKLIPPHFRLTLDELRS